MTTRLPDSAPARPGARHWASIIVGLLLFLPAAVCCGTTLLGPTVQTITLSEQAANALGPGRFVGAANYAHLPEMSAIGPAVRFTLTLAIVRVLAVAIVPPLLALGASALGTWVHGGLRLLFTLPLALFAPTALAAAWLLATPPGLVSPAGAQRVVLFVDGAQAVGLACGLGLIVYLAVARGRSDDAASRPTMRGPLLLAWMLGAIAAFTTGLQTFSLPYVLTGGGPGGATTTLALLQFQSAFQSFQFGPAAALAVLTIAPLAVLGLFAGLVVVFSGARIEHAPAARPSSPVMAARLAVVLVLVLGMAAFVLWVGGQLPLARAALLALTGKAQSAGKIAANNALRNSLVAPLAVLFVQLPLAYLAALGIGALRPLGRWSEWLLLPLSPWLFVTVGPLSLAAFMSLRQSGLVNTTAALLPALLLSVPMLFVLTMFFKGRAGRWRSARAAGRSALGAFFGELIGPSIPLALLLGVLGALVSNQELLWPLMAAAKPELATANVALVMLRGQFSASHASVAAGVMLAALPGFVFGFVALAVLQLLYVERLALRTGRDAAFKN